jgi:Ca-activated chloride channel family protein
VIPAGVKSDFTGSVDPLRYQSATTHTTTSGGDELMTIKLRYKKPAGDESRLIVHPVTDAHIALANTTDNFRFSAAVASFGMLLRNSEFKQSASFQQVIGLAKGAKGSDENGYRHEFITLVQAAGSLTAKK